MLRACDTNCDAAAAAPRAVRGSAIIGRIRKFELERILV
jgi:hypothetical protein